MKILFAADGSSHTKKALAFLVANPHLLTDTELVVLYVQSALPPNARALLGSKAVAEYDEQEAWRVLAPIEEFLRRHSLRFETRWVVGQPVAEILQAASRERAHMIVMGTHGHGIFGLSMAGSVAQGVLGGAQVPVLLVK